MVKGLVGRTSPIVEHLVWVMGNRNIALLVPGLLGEWGTCWKGWVSVKAIGTSLRSFFGCWGVSARGTGGRWYSEGMQSRDVPVVRLGTIAGDGPLTAFPVAARPPRPPAVVVLGVGGHLPGERASVPGLVVVGADPEAAGARVTLPPDAAPGTVRAVIALARELALAEWREAGATALRARQAELERELLEIGTALASERDLGALLERILLSARRLVSADAGSIYLVEADPGGGRRLRFVRAQNDSLPAPGGGAVLPLDRSSMAGMAAVTGEPVEVADAYDLPPGTPFTFNRSFDERSGYRSRSVLAVPMITRSREIVGVIQLINRKRRRDARLDGPRAVEREVVPFDSGDLELARSLAAQAAVVLENSRLLERIETLFESFVTASITAIEQRDPPTSGHSLRVARLAVALARAVDRSTDGPYRDVHFAPPALRQLRYAALLHDIGKVGVREAVLTKGTRLHPHQDEAIRERLGHACAAEAFARAVTMLERAAVTRTVPGPTDLEALERELEALRAETARRITALDRANRVVPLPEEAAGTVAAMARTAFSGCDGTPRPLLEPEEARLLSVSAGNLDDAERREIQSHVVHSHRFLTTLPWPPELERIPEIVLRHHEKLDGSGYPDGVGADSIPLEARILAVCDIYDALTAGDRPYKPALPPERAFAILREEAARGALDTDLVSLFIESGAGPTDGE